MGLGIGSAISPARLHSKMNPNELELWHFLLAFAGWAASFIGFFALVYRTWIKPAKDKEEQLNEWRWQVNADLTAGKDRMDRIEADAGKREASMGKIEAAIVRIDQCLIRIEGKLNLARDQS